MRLLMAGVDADAKDDREDYALGTIAYLQHDLSALRAARDRMNARPEPAWYGEMRARTNAEFGDARVPPWPMNLDELNGLIAYFDKPYEQAYAYTCRPPRARASGH